jgi:catechol 2,3-dioxygenase-like lactoylglutathione lyase family enzyme
MKKPNPHTGLHHVALHVKNLEACVHFYTELLGMKIIWQPDADNYYLTSGNDNFALHRSAGDFAPEKNQHLDHLGIFLATKADVDDWHNYLIANNVTIKAAPKDHRDGTRSFYCADPDGNVVQLITTPPMK